MRVADLPPVSVAPADWAREEVAIARLRRTVFIEEQGVPEALEWEDIDAQCDWFVARAGEVLVGIVRLTPDGRIGRMAVDPDWRRRGVGSRLLAAALAKARERGFRQLALSAQTQALGFYARAGFRAEGEPYLEAGIPHQKMYLNSRDD